MLAQNLRGGLGRAQLPRRRLPLFSPDSVGPGWGLGTCIPWRLWEDSEQRPGWGGGRGGGDSRLRPSPGGLGVTAAPEGSSDPRAHAVPHPGSSISCCESDGLLAVQTPLVYIRWSETSGIFWTQAETLALNGIFA